MGSTAVANPPYSRLWPQRGDCQVHSPDKRKREAAGHGRNHVHFTKRCQARLRIVKNLVLFDCRAARSTGVFIVSIGRTSTATARRASCLHPTRPRPRMRRPDTFEDDIKTVRARLSKDPAPRFGRRKRSRRRVGAEECRSRCEGGIGGMRCSVWWEIFFLGGGALGTYWNVFLPRVSHHRLLSRTSRLMGRTTRTEGPTVRPGTSRHRRAHHAVGSGDLRDETKHPSRLLGDEGGLCGKEAKEEEGRKKDRLSRGNLKKEPLKKERRRRRRKEQK